MGRDTWLPEFLERVHQVQADTGFGNVCVAIKAGQVTAIEASVTIRPDAKKLLDKPGGQV